MKTIIAGTDAPLLSWPQTPFPAGTAAVWYAGVDGLPMRAAFAPANRPRGSVVVSPGRTEPIENYAEVVSELVARGFNTLVHDWRGQGLSSRLLPDRLRGHAHGYDDFVEDFRILVDQFDARLPHPRIAVAHSMGGCLTLMALAKKVGDFDAAILSAPMLGLNTEPNPGWLARATTSMMCALGHDRDYVLGKVTDPYTVTFEADRLTHDRARYQRNRNNILADSDLALGNVTWGWVASAFHAMDWLHTAPEVAAIEVPVVVVAAELDQLVRNQELKAVTARIPGGRYVEVPGAYHEILMETDDIRASFWAEFDELVGQAPKAEGWLRKSAKRFSARNR